MAVLPRLTPRYQEVEGIRSLSRIDPLHPPWSSRRTVSLETVNAHDLLGQRSSAMKQREYHRYHSSYEAPVYGSIASKEQYRFLNILTSQLCCFQTQFPHLHLKERKNRCLYVISKSDVICSMQN